MSARFGNAPSAWMRYFTSPSGCAAGRGRARSCGPPRGERCRHRPSTRKKVDDLIARPDVEQVENPVADACGLRAGQSALQRDALGDEVLRGVLLAITLRRCMRAHRRVRRAAEENGLPRV